MKVIFLDFDGVLNSVQYDRSRGENQGNIDESRLLLLKKLVDETKAKIVLSTSWRKHWNKNESLCDAIGQEINTVFAKHGLRIYDKTPELDSFDRVAEIKKWLNNCVDEASAFVIFDDVPFGWGNLEPHLIKTNSRIGKGLELYHIEKAINMLKQI